MPRLLELAPTWQDVLAWTDYVVAGDRLLALGFSRKAIQQRVRLGRWSRLLPDIYLCQPGRPMRRQKLIAALTWSGPDSAIDGIDACRFHGALVRSSLDAKVRVIAPPDSPARSRDFVVVRRGQMPAVVESRFARYAALPDAVIAAARSFDRQSDITALFTDVLRRKALTLDELCDAHDAGSPNGRARCAKAIEAVVGGAASAAEAQMRELILSSKLLPPAVFNRTLHLPCGRVVIPDALIADSAVVHEVNGRLWHAGEDVFESMQERHDAMTVAGLTVLHNSPRRIRIAPEKVRFELEATHQRYAGRGMPSEITFARLRP